MVKIADRFHGSRIFAIERMGHVAGGVKRRLSLVERNSNGSRSQVR